MKLLLKNLLFTVLVPGMLAGYLPVVLVRPEQVDLAGAGFRAVPALLFLGLGMLTYFLCVWDFAVTGRGTPAPIDAPKVLVIRGLYRYLRNPMYLGVLSVVLGWAILTAAPVLVLYLMALAGGFHLFVIAHEERTLRRRFGAEYEAYCVAVPRWLPRRHGGAWEDDARAGLVFVLAAAGVTGPTAAQHVGRATLQGGLSVPLTPSESPGLALNTGIGFVLGAITLGPELTWYTVGPKSVSPSSRPENGLVPGASLRLALGPAGPWTPYLVSAAGLQVWESSRTGYATGSSWGLGAGVGLRRAPSGVTGEFRLVQSVGRERDRTLLTLTAGWTFGW